MHRRDSDEKKCSRHSNLFTYCSETIYFSYLSMFLSACRVSAKCNTMQISHSQALTQYFNEAMLCYSVSLKCCNYLGESKQHCNPLIH